MKMKIHAFYLLFLILVTACITDETHKIQFPGEAQGTYYAVTYFAGDTLVSQQQIDSLLDDFDQSASLWVKNSLLTRINNNDPDVLPGEHLLRLFELSREISELTGGAFDITVGPLVKAWGFWYEAPIKVDYSMLDSLLPLVDYHGVEILNDKIIKKNPHIQFDFNAIAQGYSVDLLGSFLEKHGIQNYLIDIGGEVLARGTKPDGDHWVVGIEKPSNNPDAPRELKATLQLKNKAIATSGNYRKFYEIDGIRYSHTIDPKTGYPVRHSLLSATVMANDAARADGLATAFMVMGVEKSIDFIKNHPGIDGYLIYSDQDGSLKTWISDGLQQIIDEQ